MAKQIREISRNTKIRTPHHIVIIVCEGEKTEPIYFKYFRGRNKLISIKIVKSTAGKNYDALIKKGIEEKTGIESSCTVWCVSDVDVDYNTPNNLSAKNKQLKRYVKAAADNGFNIALSNPCFEFWFLLHFIYTTGYIQNYDSAVKKLSEYIENYQKNSDVYNLLSDKKSTAIRHAKKLKLHYEREEKNDFFDASLNPYTNVWELVESLTEI